MPKLRAPKPTAKNRPECLEYAKHVVATVREGLGEVSQDIGAKVTPRVLAARDPVIADPNPGCPIDATCGRDFSLVVHLSDLTKALTALEKYLAALRRTY